MARKRRVPGPRGKGATAAARELVRHSDAAGGRAFRALRDRTDGVEMRVTRAKQVSVTPPGEERYCSQGNGRQTKPLVVVLSGSEPLHFFSDPVSGRDSQEIPFNSRRSQAKRDDALAGSDPDAEDTEAGSASG